MVIAAILKVAPYLDYGSSDLVWTKLEPAAGVAPPPRWRHTSTCISKTQVLVFGGFHSSTTRLNDLWIFDLPSKQVLSLPLV